MHSVTCWTVDSKGFSKSIAGIELRETDILQQCVDFATVKSQCLQCSLGACGNEAGGGDNNGVDRYGPLTSSSTFVVEGILAHVAIMDGAK